MKKDKLSPDRFYIVGYNIEHEEIANIGILKKYIDEKNWSLLGAAFERFMSEAKDKPVAYVKCGFPSDLDNQVVMLGNPPTIRISKN